MAYGRDGFASLFGWKNGEPYPCLALPLRF